MTERTHMSRALLVSPLVFTIVSLSLAGCGIKEKLEQRAKQEIAEKIVEAAAGGEVDIDSKSGHVVVTGEDGKTYDYAQGQDGSARVQGSDGLDASTGTTIPADFPFNLPSAQKVHMAQRVALSEGGLVFQVTLEAKTDDLEGVATLLRMELEGKGVKVQRTELANAEGKLVTLSGKNASGKIEANCMITSPKPPNSTGVMIIATWNDTSGKR